MGTGLCPLAWGGDKVGVVPTLCVKWGGVACPSLRGTSLLVCPCPTGGRRERGVPGREERAGPERSLKRGRKWGPAAPSYPLPASLREEARPGSVMAPWRKADKERHGVGRCGRQGAAGSGTGGGRAASRRMLRGWPRGVGRARRLQVRGRSLRRGPGAEKPRLGERTAGPHPAR